MKPLARLLLTAGLLLMLAIPTTAGIRSVGDYAGVVVFDRWGSCYIVSGPYLMYIAEQEKEKLRSREDQAVLIDALDVLQWINPGDGVIRDLTFLGWPEDDKDSPIDGVELEAELGDSLDNVVLIWVTVRNQSQYPREIWLNALAPTLFYPKNPACLIDFSGSIRSPDNAGKP